MIFSGNILKQTGVLKILCIYQINFPFHAQVLYGQGIDFLFSDLIHAGAFREYGYTEVPSDQVLDGRDVVNLQNYIEVFNAEVALLQGCGKQAPGV